MAGLHGTNVSDCNTSCTSFYKFSCFINGSLLLSYCRRNSRGWFPNTVPEADGHIRQPLLRDVHSNLAASPTQGFGKFSEHANVDRRKPHWGNSYEAAAPGPQDRFRAHELGISTDNMYSVLTKPNNYPGRQPNIRGNLQVLHLAQNFSCQETTHFFISAYSIYDEGF